MEEHPLPWKVAYNKRFPTWSPKSEPRVVDADGVTVCTIPSHVVHPGLRDTIACKIAQTIVDSVNGSLEFP